MADRNCRLDLQIRKLETHHALVIGDVKGDIVIQELPHDGFVTVEACQVQARVTLVGRRVHLCSELEQESNHRQSTASTSGMEGGVELK